MTRVLKMQGGIDAATVRSVQSAWTADRSAPVEATAPTVDPEWLALSEEHERLKTRLEQKEAEITDLRKQVQAAFRKGEVEGLDAGLRAAEDDSVKRLSRLESGVKQAVSTYMQVLSGLERLAPALAREGLATLLGQSDRAELVTAIVLRQLKAIETQSIVHIEVAATDFGDDDALARLAEGLGGLKIHAVKALKSGDCRIRLSLGTLEVGLDQQWGRLDDMLRELSEPTGSTA